MNDMMPGCDYPPRPQYFAMTFQRQLIVTRAIDLIGIDAFALLVLVVLAEDEGWYRRPPSFWNGQLESALGGWSDDKMRRVRKRAEHHGLLHYERKSDRSVGYYWVLTPHWLEMPETPQPAITRTGAGDPAGGCAGGTAGGCAAPPIPIPSPNPIPKASSPSPPSGAIPAEWLAVVEAMQLAQLSDWQTPLRCLREHQVPPVLALDVLRYASETGAWSGGKLRRRLLNLLPGQDPRNLSLWMKPDHPQRLPATERVATPAERVQTALLDRDRRLRQLQLEFEPLVRDRPLRTIAQEFELPPPLRERLLQYRTWNHINSDAVRLAVLEIVQQRMAVATN